MSSNSIILAAIIAAYPGSNETSISDPYWQNVALLMHADGTDAANFFTDATGKSTLTTVAVGSSKPYTSTRKSFAGPTSAYFDGMGGHINSSLNPDFSFPAGTDFTIEAWVNMTSLVGSGQVPRSCIIFGFDATSGDGSGPRTWSIFVSNNGALIFENAASDGSRNFAMSSAAAAIRVNSWQHVAIVRKGTTMYMFIDGRSIAFTKSGPASVNVDVLSSGYIRLGRLYTSSDWDYRLNGYIDEVRITKGVARYSADFTPPPGAFANNA
jgi:hypothetical protein